MEYSDYAFAARRVVRTRSRPTLSIVLASVGSRAMAESCVAAIASRCEAAGAEVIVVRPLGAPLMGSSIRHRSGVRVVTAPAESSLEELRTHGMRVAQGDIVVLLEDSPGTAFPALDRMLEIAAQREEAPAMTDTDPNAFSWNGASEPNVAQRDITAASREP